MLRNRFHILITVFITLLAGCSPVAATGTLESPESGIDLSSPPPVVLHIRDLTQEGVLRGYCWTEPKSPAGVCADPLELGIPTAAKPMVVVSPIAGSLDIDFPHGPDKLNLTIYPVGQDTPPAPGPGGWVYWKPEADGQTFSSLPVLPDLAFNVDLDTGLYVFGFSVNWEVFGVADYSYLVEVE